MLLLDHLSYTWPLHDMAPCNGNMLDVKGNAVDCVWGLCVRLERETWLGQYSVESLCNVVQFPLDRIRGCIHCTGSGTDWEYHSWWSLRLFVSVHLSNFGTLKGNSERINPTGAHKKR